MYHKNNSGMKCGVSETNLKMSLVMYSSYFVLFARFFYNTYFSSGTGGKGEKCKASSAGEMILKIEKKIQQQTEEIVTAASSSAVCTEETKNNCEPTQPQEDNDTKKEIGKSKPDSLVKSTNEEEEIELEDAGKVCISKIERRDSLEEKTCQNNHSRGDSMNVADQKTSSEFPDQEMKDEENKSPDDKKLDDNTNANTTSQK